MDVEKRPSRGTRFLSLSPRARCDISLEVEWSLAAPVEKRRSCFGHSGWAARARKLWPITKAAANRVYDPSRASEAMISLLPQLNSTRLDSEPEPELRFMNSDTATLGSKCGMKMTTMTQREEEEEGNIGAAEADNRSGK